LPHRLRYLLGYNHDLCSRVLKIFVRSLLTFYRARARKRNLLGAQTGSVTFIQRFGSSLNLNLHYHTLVLDGVFTTAPGQPTRFHALPPPSDEEVAKLLARVYRRVLAWLARKGILNDDDDTADPLCDAEPTLAACYGASVRHCIGLGPKAGQPLARIGAAPYARWVERRGSCHAHLNGFDLHATLSVPARQRKRLEQLVRYCARPPLSHERLARLPDQRVVVRLKTRWNDGTTHLAFEPLTFIEKLTALIPRPRINLVVYHGILAPHAGWRVQAVGYRRRPVDKNHSGSASPRGRRQWAELMRRAFGFELLTCPKCAAKMKLIACVTQPDAIRAILTALKLPAAPPQVQAARAPPTHDDLELNFDVSA